MRAPVRAEMRAYVRMHAQHDNARPAVCGACLL